MVPTCTYRNKKKNQGYHEIDAEETDLPKNKRNTNTYVHKTLVQKMMDNNVQDTLYINVTGHKNVSSLITTVPSVKITKGYILSRTDSNARSFELPSTPSSGYMNTAQCHAVLPQSQRKTSILCNTIRVITRKTSKSFVQGCWEYHE